MRKVAIQTVIFSCVLVACTDSSTFEPRASKDESMVAAKLLPASESPPRCTSYLYDSSCGQPVTDFAQAAAGGALSRQAAEVACRDWDPNCRPRDLSTTERQWISRQLARYDSSVNPNCWQLAGTARFLLANSGLRAYDNPYTVTRTPQLGDLTISYTAGDTHGALERQDEPLGIHIGAYRRPDATSSQPTRLPESDFVTIFMHEIVHAAFYGAIHDNGSGQALYTTLRQQCG